MKLRILVCFRTVILVTLFVLPLSSVRAFSVIPELPDTSATSEFRQIIGAGTLTVDIVDGSYVTVANPSVDMNSTTFAFACHATTGIFGSTSEQIYVKNPDAADGGWAVTLAAANPATMWTSSVSFDFNDPSAAGCTDGGDADNRPGQMTVNPNAGTLTEGACLNCDSTGVTKGTQAAFVEDVLDSVTILTAADTSDDIGDWKLIGATVSQTIPPEQPAAADYSLNLTLTIVAVI